MASSIAGALLVLAVSVNRQAMIGEGSPGREPHPDIHGPNGLDLERIVRRNDTDALSRLKLDGPPGGVTFTISDAKNPLVKAWWDDDAAVSERFMRYFAYCAYGEGKKLSYRKKLWKGRLGLAQASADQARDMTEEERQWVSACLLAHANQKHAIQHISLRGGPLGLETGERFAMGFPEGLFFGDLFRTPAATRLYTMSLDLPPGYDPKTAQWWPPNVALGRTIDFDGAKWVSFLGPCQEHADRFGPPGAGADPVHRRTRVCASASFATCPAGDLYRPLFVYGPRLANLEVTSPASSASLRAQTLAATAPDLGLCNPQKPVPGPSRKEACVGRYDPLDEVLGSVCNWSSTWTKDDSALPVQFAQLKANQTVTAVLRAVGSDVVDAALGSAFTAIIRFRTSGQQNVAQRRLTYSVKNAAGDAWVSGTPSWDTSRGDKGYSWLEVYPVYLLPDDSVPPADAKPALAIRLTGGQHPGGPELDAVGFTPGEPWCCQGDEAPPWCAAPGTTRAGVCSYPIPDVPAKVPQKKGGKGLPGK